MTSFHLQSDINNFWLALLLLPAYLCSNAETITITNSSPVDRNNVVVEIPGNTILNKYGKDLAIFNSLNEEIPYQQTFDGNILIQATIRAGATIELHAKAGAPSVADTVCVGQIRHDFQDDFTWENDLTGFRLYGPSYRAGGGNVAGYDVWTKNVEYPVLAQRYEDHCIYGISYHKDHGTGMDCYTVGHTLGAGMNALVSDGEIAYPCAYETCEILDNGPFRTSARIVCYPEKIGPDSGVVEERIISLDKGSWLNKTVVTYKGISKEYPLVSGIVIHKQNPQGYFLDEEKRFVAYADLTDNVDNGNGVIYIGVVNHAIPEETTYEKFAQPQGDAIGHAVNKTSISPSEEYIYYWGAGWSKGGVKGMRDWQSYLAAFYNNLKYPLKITIN